MAPEIAPPELMSSVLELSANVPVPFPTLIADALVVPMLMVPVVPVAVPTSSVKLPELDVSPVAFPVRIVVAAELVEAVAVSVEPITPAEEIRANTAPVES